MLTVKFQGVKGLMAMLILLPPVKGTYTFWRVRGIIDGFEKLRRNIALGVEKTANKPMIAIQF